MAIAGKKSTELPADGKGFDSDTRWQEGREETIVVVRREIIAEIEVGENGVMGPVEAAMRALGSHFDTLDGDKSTVGNYEFTYQDRTFEIKVG
jgi:hypothetical protein